MSDKEEPNFDALEEELDVSPLDQDAVQMHELYKSLLKAGFREKAALYLVAMIVNESMEDNAGITFTMLDPEEMEDDSDDDNGTEVWKIASSEEEKISEIFGVLEETGAIEWIGLDQEGEPVYRITEKCKDVFPEFYAMYRQEVNQTANDLWQLGLVDITFNTDQSVSIRFTSENYSRYRQLKDTLTDEQRIFLEAVIGSSLRDVDRHL